MLVPVSVADKSVICQPRADQQIYWPVIVHCVRHRCRGKRSLKALALIKRGTNSSSSSHGKNARFPFGDAARSVDLYLICICNPDRNVSSEISKLHALLVAQREFCFHRVYQLQISTLAADEGLSLRRHSARSVLVPVSSHLEQNLQLMPDNAQSKVDSQRRLTVCVICFTI